MLCRNERKVESFPDLGVSCVVCGVLCRVVVGVEGVVWCVMEVIGDELFNHCSFFVRVLLCCGLDGGLMI